MSVAAAVTLLCAALLAVLLDARRATDRPPSRLLGGVLLTALVLSTATGAVLTVLRIRAGG